MGIFQIALMLVTFLCSLVAGLLFVFALVVMPGIRSLNDREFIRAFQVMDRVIQNNQPLFALVWVGSVVALGTSAVLGIGQLDGAGLLSKNPPVASGRLLSPVRWIDVYGQSSTFFVCLRL